MFRSEARGVPSLLTAKVTTISTAPEYDVRDEALEDSVLHTGDGGGQYEDEEAEEAEDYGEDTRGWYEDGTYIATGTASYPQRPPSPKKIALLAWHESFMSTFRQLRKVLHGSPPTFASQSSASQSNALPYKQEDWLHLIYNTSPTPSFLWKMDQYTVLKGFKYMVDLLKVGSDTPIEQTQWIYGLLLRCSEVMTPDEVYIVRELGKKAILVQKKLAMSNCLSGNKKDPSTPITVPEQEVQSMNNTEDNAENGEHGEDGEKLLGEIEAEGVKVKDGNDIDPNMPLQASEVSDNRLAPAVESHESPVEVQADPDAPADEEPSSHDPSFKPEAHDPESVANQRLTKRRKNRKAKNGNYNYVPSPNTLSTLDMIISIVGDFFGQRDLLEERKYHTLGGSWEVN